jgi:hypothetical protein
MLQRPSVMAFLIQACSLLAIQTASGYRGEETPDLTSLPDADLTAVTVNFERTRCYGTCAAYAMRFTAMDCSDMPSAFSELRARASPTGGNHCNSERWTGDQSKTGPFGTACFDRSR